MRYNTFVMQFENVNLFLQIKKYDDIYMKSNWCWYNNNNALLLIFNYRFVSYYDVRFCELHLRELYKREIEICTLFTQQIDRLLISIKMMIQEKPQSYHAIVLQY